MTEVTVTPPGGYRLTSRAGSNAETRSQGIGNATAEPGTLPGLLAEHGMILVAAYEFEREDAVPGSSTRSAAPGSGSPAVIDVALAPGESAAVLVEQDDAFTWAFPDETQKAQRSREFVGARQAAATTLTFYLGESEPARSPGSRGLKQWFAKLVGKKVKTYVFKFVAAFAVDKAMKFLERDIGRGLVLMEGQEPEHWAPLPSLANRAWRGKRPRILLFVHGTFSSTQGSYGGLCKTPEGKKFLEAAKAYDLIIGFDHPTLSEDPLENAIALLQALSTIQSEEPPVLHAVAFSRGGLVLRSLIELLLPQFGLERYV